MRPFLRRLLLFALASLALAVALDQLLKAGLRARRTHTLGTWNRLVEGRLDAEVLFTGSSRALVHYDARSIGRRIGRRCYNLGMDGSQLDLQLPWLKTYLKYDPAPDLVVQEVDIISLRPDTDIFFPSQYIAYLGEPPIRQALEHIDPSWCKDRWIPLYSFSRFGYGQAALALKGLAGLEDTLDDPLDLGFELRDWAWDGTFDRFRAAHPNGVRQGIDPRSVERLREIVRTVKASGSRIALAYAPELRENQLLTLDRDTIMATYRRIAQEEGIPFWDFSSGPMNADRRYFYNSQHLNAEGVARLTPMVADSVAALLRE